MERLKTLRNVVIVAAIAAGVYFLPGGGRAAENRLTDQRKAELAVEDAEAAMRALEDELADPAAWATRYEAAKSEARHTAARRAVEDAYTRLEALID